MAIALIRKSLATTAPAATVFVRIIVGWVFLSEGILKFIPSYALGAARFAHIGIPAPQVMGPFVGVVEIVCGTLLILGLLTRLAAVPLLINISVAILSTKVPIGLGHGYWMFTLPKLSRYGFWSMMHEARTDFSMWMGLVFLLFVGAGSVSLDAMMTHGSKRRLDPPGVL
jgi:putative oxidoreductase